MKPALTPDLLARESQALEAVGSDAGTAKAQASALFREGFPERALLVFERVRSADAADVEALGASVNLLAGLKRPQAAWQLAQDHQEMLEATVPGCIAVASAAQAAGKTAAARGAYSRALSLDATNTRALTGLAFLEAQAGEHASAISRLETCLRADPSRPDHWSNLVDVLTLARRAGDAHGLLQRAMSYFPQDLALAVRLPVLKAYIGDFAGAEKLFSQLPEKSWPLLADIIKAGSPASAATLKSSRAILPNARELFAHYAFDGMRQADWRQEALLTGTLRELLAKARKTGGQPDWRDALFYTLMLPLSEIEQLQLRDETASTIRAFVSHHPLPETGEPPPRTDGKLHIGISAPSLLEPRAAHALREELRAHDLDRFAFHIYSPVPSQDNAVAAFFEGVAEVVEIGRYSTAEAVLRMRLDRLDLFLDLTYFTPVCRVEIIVYRVAPIMVRRQTWQRTHRIPCDYTMGDVFTHPGPLEQLRNGAIARMPSTCWIGFEWGQAEAAPVTRLEAGLADDALVLCAFVGSTVTLDPLTFGTWMRILRALPKAVLWLMPVEDTARTHLEREAAAAGIDPARLVFAPKLRRDAFLAHLPLADLHLDTLRYNSPQIVADMLRAGVPALAVAGYNMASRLGGSVVHAAGMPECVLPDAAAYEAEAIRLGKDAGAREALRAKLAANRATAPLFDMKARAREWENAWVTMIERQRAGLPPQAFDVMSANP